VSSSSMADRGDGEFSAFRVLFAAASQNLVVQVFTLRLPLVGQFASEEIEIELTEHWPASSTSMCSAANYVIADRSGTLLDLEVTPAGTAVLKASTTFSSTQTTSRRRTSSRRMRSCPSSRIRHPGSGAKMYANIETCCGVAGGICGHRAAIAAAGRPALGRSGVF